MNVDEAYLLSIIARKDNRIEQLEAALRSIADKCPATCDMTLAHEMAQEAETALAQSSPPKVLLPCPVCGGEAIHAVDVLKRTVIQPARQENDDVFRGFRGNNEA